MNTTLAQTNPFDPMYALLAMLPADVRANMVTMYREALVVQVAQLEQAVTTADDASMRDLAHKIAGSAGMMQNAMLSRAARQMEIALREGRGDAACDAWPDVEGCVHSTLAALDCMSAA